MRSRVGSERALWTTATSRRSWGGDVMVAMVERMRAGDGTGRLLLSCGVVPDAEMHQRRLI